MLNFTRMLRCFTALAVIFALNCKLFAEKLYTPQGRPARYAGKFSAAPVFLPDTLRRTPWQFRGVWIATMENIDFSQHQSVAEYKRDAVVMLDKIRAFGFNAVLFQVRSNCTAWYPSAINPYPRYLTGVEGVGLGNFDPLDFLVRETHRRGMEFHAWFNPYRVIGSTPLSKTAYLATLDKKNFAVRNPNFVLSVPIPNGNSLLLDPGEPAVRRHILATVDEVLRKYPVDGIHFDDYFYLYYDMGNSDHASFARNNPQKYDLARWRRNNVTTLVREVHNLVAQFRKKTGRKVSFGISPFGIWANAGSVKGGSLTGGKQTLITQYSDTRLWIKERLVDYIAPQLYWYFDHDVAAYAALTDWWCDTVRGTGVRLYIGHGVYNVGTKPWWGSREIVNQLRYDNAKPEITGEIMFSAKHIITPDTKAKRASAEYVRNFWLQLNSMK